MVTPEPAPAFQVQSSRHFAAFLAAQRTSLAFSTYQSGKLFLVGLKPTGELSIFERTFNRCMGLWADGQTLWMSTAWQLWRCENALASGEIENGFDRLYVPRTGHTTGDVDAHDVAVDADGRVVFVNTLFSCLATVSETASFRALWKPPFVSRLAAEDRCHLNGLAMEDGRPRYVTAAARTDVADGWRERRRDGGIVIDVASGEVAASGLSMPHSPRLHEGRLYVLDSGTGFFGTVDLSRGAFEPIAFCPGYPRGLAFVGGHAVIGLSKPRDGTFTGLALDDNLKARGAEARCGLLVVDLKTGDATHWLRVEGVVEELYDVVALADVVRPTALGFKTDEIRYTVTVEGERTIWRAGATGPQIARATVKPAERLYAKASRALAEGQLELARETAQRLVERAPRYAAGHALLGAIHQQGRDWASAVVSHRDASALAPEDPAILNNLGLALRESGDARASAEVLREAVRLRPGYALALNNLGLALLAMDDVSGAIAALRDALGAKPDYARARHNLGNALRRAGPRAEGTAELREALRLDPLYAEAWNSLGAALHEDGAHREAEDALRRALHIRPRYPKALLNLAHLHADLERTDDALAGYRQALAIEPGYVKALLGLASVLQRQGRTPSALEAADAAVTCAPRSAEAHAQRATILRAAGRLADALASHEQALALDPGHVAARAGRLELRSEQSDWRERDEDIAVLREKSRDALARGDVPPLTASAAHRFVPCTAEEQLALARAASARIASRLAPLRESLAFAHAPTRRERLRIGYLSCDFRHNAVGHLTQGLFRSHDRSRIEAFAYSYGPDDGSRYRRRIEEDAEHFVDLAALGHAEAARRIHADGIDVLVDLVGGAGNGRLEILALRPAPVQVHFLGYPATVGRALVDYFVADPVTVPAGAEVHFDEAVVRLPDSYQLNDDWQEIATATPTRADYGLPEAGFVFACFNAGYKIDPRIFQAWTHILGRVPGSVLWLLESAPAGIANLRREAATRGIDPARLVFARLVDKPIHLARHRLAGLFLDTPLCNAHTTASDSLWAGLPVLTTPGDTFASRVAASLLAAARLPELITPDLDAYVETAVRLTGDPVGLASLTARLREAPARLPLFDTDRTLRHLERAYDVMWARCLSGDPPAGFAVDRD